MVEHNTNASCFGLLTTGLEEEYFLPSHPPDLNSGTHWHEKTDPQSTVFSVISFAWLFFFYLLNFFSFS
ncbi:hypothetical protein I79_026214 [Cricetulus griseus]|uniref:Uncharacterized protein n=1 Tax=Cricetulus griseus TaxID=10029 RepID=G3IQA8_CRIGR|nr:hypothetical protein I79_026214 [Cricetulus griseus]